MYQVPLSRDHPLVPGNGGLHQGGKIIGLSGRGLKHEVVSHQAGLKKRGTTVLLANTHKPVHK